jgi:hypothetical protein
MERAILMFPRKWASAAGRVARRMQLPEVQHQWVRALQMWLKPSLVLPSPLFRDLVARNLVLWESKKLDFLCCQVEMAVGEKTEERSFQQSRY